MKHKKKHFKILTKILLSTISLSSIAIAPNFQIVNNSSKNNLVVNSVDNQAFQFESDLSKAGNLVPNPNDIYNDYISLYGFLMVDKLSSTITFYDWFSFKQWSFNVNDNSSTLFGSQKKVATLNVKPVDNLKTILVYGNFENSESFLFQLNISDGSVYSATNKRSIVGQKASNSVVDPNSMINQINVASITSNNEVILSPKFSSSSQTTLTFSFSVVNLNNYSVTNYTNYKIEIPDEIETNANNTTTPYTFVIGEIIGAIKKIDADNKVNFDFAFKLARVPKTTSNNVYYFQYWGGVIAFKDGVSTSKVYKYQYSRDISINGDEINNNVNNIKNYIDSQNFLVNAPYTVITNYDTRYQSILVGIKKDFSWQHVGTLWWTNFFIFQLNSLQSDSTNQFANITVKETSNNSIPVGGTTSKSGAIVDFVTYKDSANLIVYGVLVNNSNKSEMTLVKIDFATPNSSYSASTWMDLTYKVTDSIDPILSLKFIPKSLQSGKIIAYINDLGSESEPKLFYYNIINAGTPDIVNAPVYTFEYTDSQLNQLYETKLEDSSIYKEIAENASILYKDNVKQEVANIDYSGFKVSKDYKGLIGNLRFTVNNWWNTEQTTLVREMNIGNYYYQPSTLNVLLLSTMLALVVILSGFVILGFKYRFDKSIKLRINETIKILNTKKNSDKKKRNANRKPIFGFVFRNQHPKPIVSQPIQNINQPLNLTNQVNKQNYLQMVNNVNQNKPIINNRPPLNKSNYPPLPKTNNNLQKPLGNNKPPFNKPNYPPKPASNSLNKPIGNNQMNNKLPQNRNNLPKR